MGRSGIGGWAAWASGGGGPGRLAGAFDAVRRMLPLLYLAWALPLLAALCWLTPPFQTPDEVAQLARVDQVAHGIIVGRRHGTASGGRAHEGIAAAAGTFRDVAFHGQARVSAAMLRQAEAVRWGPVVFYENPNTVQYPPAFYLPQALTLRIVQARGMTVIAGLRLVRLANGLVAALMAAGAVHLARRTRPLLLMLAMLPMTLSLFASASQDAGLIAAGLLAVAVLDRVIEEQRDATRAEWLAIVLLLGAVAMARPPYGPLALCGLLTTRRWSRAGAAAVAAMLVPALGWAAIAAAWVTVPMNEANPAAQLAFVRAHPWALPSALARSWRDLAPVMANQLVGVLGWLDTRLPLWVYGVGRDALALGLLALLGGRGRRSSVVAAAVLAVPVLLAVVQYFAWNGVGAMFVAGLQGRYFTPVLAVCGLAVPGWPALRRLQRPAYAAVAVLGCVAPAAMLQALVARYWVG